MLLNKNDITDLSFVQRLNLINCVTGIKPGNLIGSISSLGNHNAAVISSIVHLSSNPALIGFFMRPHKEYRRDTYKNIMDTGYYTINSIPIENAEQAHYTSAKLDEDISEFEVCNLTPEFLDNFIPPFVKESIIKLGMKHVESIPITASNTTLIIGEIQLINIEDALLSEEYHVDLEKANCAGIGGLNSYYSLKKEGIYPYARVKDIPNFEN